jgi:hypothetical protein
MNQTKQIQREDGIIKERRKKWNKEGEPSSEWLSLSLFPSCLY